MARFVPGGYVPKVQDFAAALGALGHRDRPRYEPVMALARMLLVGGGPMAVVGRGGIAGWWLDMPTLFERVTTSGVVAWAKSQGLRAVVQPRHKRAILDGQWRPYREARPDVELHDAQGRLIAVVDAKYKAYVDADVTGAPIRPVDPADIYQLAFYGLRGQAQGDDAFQGVFLVLPTALPAADRPALSHAVSARELEAAGGGRRPRAAGGGGALGLVVGRWRARASGGASGGGGNLGRGGGARPLAVRLS